VQKLYLKIKDHWLFVILWLFVSWSLGKLFDLLLSNYQIVGRLISETFFTIATFKMTVPIVPVLSALILVGFIKRRVRAFQASQRKLRIIKATYGTNTKKIDITNELNNAIVDNKLKIIIDNNIAGDPHRRESKKAVVKYIFNEQQYDIECDEYGVLELPFKEGQN
jgi:hypothetical protein